MSGPTDEDIRAACDALQREMESPEFADAMRRVDAILDELRPAHLSCEWCDIPIIDRDDPHGNWLVLRGDEGEHLGVVHERCPEPEEVA